MAYPVDPMKTKYWPEIFGEAGAVTTSASGEEIGEYSNYGDYIVQLVNLATTHETTTGGVPTSAIRVNTDAGDNMINSMLSARGHIDNAIPVKVTGKGSLSIYGYYPSGGAAELMRYRYGLRITKPTVYEKLLYNIDLTDEEKVLDDKFEISKKIAAGTLSGQSEHTYTKIYEVAKSITASSGANPTVGQIVHPLAGQKAVLLGISTEEHTTASEVFISVTRDGEQVMKLDSYGFKAQSDYQTNTAADDYQEQLNYEMPLYVVAMDKLRVWIENSGSAITSFKVRFRYGIAPLTILERVKWGLPLTDDEKMLADTYDLEDSARAGVF